MWFAASRLSYLGIFFGVAAAIGYFAGHWADDRFHTTPWLSMVGLMVGIAAGFKELWRVTKQLRKEQEQDTASK